MIPKPKHKCIMPATIAALAFPKLINENGRNAEPCFTVSFFEPGSDIMEFSIRTYQN